MLIGKDQDRVLGEGVFDPAQIRGVDWRPQVDVADFGSEAWRDRIAGDGHDHALGHEVSAVLEKLNHGGPMLAFASRGDFYTRTARSGQIKARFGVPSTRPTPRAPPRPPL